jgi:uncharacterized protein YjbI with pentapeptide repeats
MDNVLSTMLEVADRLRDGQLVGCAVRSVDLSQVSFERKTLSDVTLTRVGLTEARLHGLTAINLQVAESAMRRAQLTKAYIQRSNFLNCEAFDLNAAGAIFEDTKWFESQLPNINLSHGRLHNCQFQAVELYGANFEFGCLASCSFTDPRMGHASLNRAKFHGAMLIDVDLVGANLHASDFSEAVLIRVNFQGANLARANFRNATLIDCKYHRDDLVDTTILA